MPDYPLFKLVSLFYEVVPPVLQAGGKVRQKLPFESCFPMIPALLQPSYEPLCMTHCSTRWYPRAGRKVRPNSPSHLALR